MSEKTTQPTSQRRHGAALEKALLTAAWAELKAVGYSQLTYDAVAERAGTSRSVLYRRWPHKHELVMAAMRNSAPLLSGPIPNTGSLRGDVVALLERASRQLQIAGDDVILGLLSDIIASPYMLSQVIRVSNVSKEIMTTILRQAEARGEVDLQSIPDVVITLPLDLNRHEIFLTSKPLSRAKIAHIVDYIFLPLVLSKK